MTDLKMTQSIPYTSLTMMRLSSVPDRFAKGKFLSSSISPIINLPQYYILNDLFICYRSAVEKRNATIFSYEEQMLQLESSDSDDDKDDESK